MALLFSIRWLRAWACKSVYLDGMSDLHGLMILEPST